MTNKVYAMKEIKALRNSNESQKRSPKKIKLLENLAHSNIIIYFSSFSENGNFYNMTYSIFLIIFLYFINFIQDYYFI